MKAMVIFVLFLFVGFLTTAQDMSKSKMLKGVEVKPPLFTGIKGTVDVIKATDFGSIYDYLSEKTQYPDNFIKRITEGTAIIQFTVFPNGNLGDFQIVNSVSDEIDREVIRVLESTNGMWIPGKNNGNSVEMQREVSVTFMRDGSNHLQLAHKYYKRSNKKLMKNKPKRALRFVNYAMVYQPYSDALLFLRARTHLELGNSDNACQDFNRMKALGYDYIDGYLKEYCEIDKLALVKRD
ncbi:TonB family protein [Marinifilum sp. N1E240]|uniref:TonB family protein n=1 Tax=Marinifilum sp. N1E240 TaxID=2608082 RepID=UPI00128C8C34|nr:TonB family protein [Marinifilum sp. N1E240]MPQ47849.1 TonB family protein [Marinifilum sp. N1E240]